MNNFKNVLYEEDLKKHTTLGIGGICKYFISPESIDEFIEALKYLKENNIKYFIIGKGSNVIIDDSYFSGAVISLSNLKSYSYNGDTITCESGLSLSVLARKTLEDGYTNLAFLMMIPGNIGGSIVGNAGCYNDDILSHTLSVKVLDKDFNIIDLDIKDISFGYRYSSLYKKYIVLSATFKLERGNVEEAKAFIKEKNEKRISSQPLDQRSVGSIFKNPEGTSAGKLIDDLGLKGHSIGGAKVSEKHANFIVNYNNATFNDMISLINYVKEKVYETYNISLEVEPKIIRWDEI